MSRQVHLVRHGIAEEPAEGVADAGRVLTKEGRTKTRRAAKGLAAAGVRPQAILASPLPRAAQTAGILAEALAPAGGVELVEWLSCGADPQEVAARLAKRPEESVLLVGHMPDLAGIASHLLGGRALDIVFKKAGACALAFDGEVGAGRGRLDWLLQPRHLFALAGKGGR